MSEQLAWTDAAWKDYLYWQTQDKKGCVLIMC
ncbi:type II toxin-antitoxin system YoeB family toxin [Psychrobacter sp. AOP7-D1-15]|nr:type II toxin-antitoxin system YoeB family toxin [Psychrobacter sp. FME61]